MFVFWEDDWLALAWVALTFFFQGGQATNCASHFQPSVFCLSPHRRGTDTRWRSEHSLAMSQLPNQITRPSPLTLVLYTDVFFELGKSLRTVCVGVYLHVILCVIWRLSIETEDVGPSLSLSVYPQSKQQASHWG